MRARCSARSTSTAPTQHLADATGRNFGFSFQVVTNTLGGDNQDDDGSNLRTVQGSLRQFIQNANAIAGAANMRFVPAVAPDVVNGAFSDDGNYTNDGGDDWWQITVSTALPAITDSAGTTIDGTAYSRFDGVTLANTNTGTVGYMGAVGLGADGIAGTGDDPAPLSGVIKPELEIREVVVGDVDIGLEVRANNVTIRAISIHGFGTPGDIFSDGDIVVGHNFGSDVGENLTGILIEDNVIGSGPAALANPGDASVSGIAVFGADGGTIRRNAIAWAGDFGIFLTSNADGWTVTRNDIRENAQADGGHDGIDIGNLSGGAIVTENYFFSNEGVGVDGYRSDGGNTIRDNTIDSNGAGGTETAGIRLYGTGSTVSQNVISNNTGAGVLVVRNDGVTNTPAAGHLITRNSFLANGSNAIDLASATTGNNNLGDGVGVTANANSGNAGLARPIITAAGLAGTSLTVSGTATANATIEIYRAVGAANDTLSGVTYGEGVQFLGTATANGAGVWTNTFDVTGLLSVGQFVSAIAISGTNNTSEFGANFTVAAARTIAGTIYDDVNADAAVSALEGVFANAANAVKLFIDTDNDGALDATDALVATTSTNASGDYSFVVTPGPITRYWVVVDSRQLGASAYNGAFGIGDIWAEQTYANANLTTIGAASGAGFVTTAGALYGGKSALISDVATNATNAEHLFRVDLSGGSVAGVNAGFSFNAVTNTRDADDDAAPRTAQGTLRQFIQNADAISGANTMRFVPAVAPNDVSGLWWTITATSALPVITDANTTIDGTAYYNTSGVWGPAGVTVRDTNTGQVGTGGLVGVDALTLDKVNRPELELTRGGAFAGDGIAVSAGAVTVKNLAVNSFNGSQIYVSSAVTAGAGQAIITGTLVGTHADGTDAGGTENYGIRTNGAATISNNYIGYVEGNAVMMSDA